LPATRYCVACAAVVDEKYGGEFRIAVQEVKLGRKGGLKITGVDYDVELRRNPRVPLRFNKDE
jgi:hypothetical protein